MVRFARGRRGRAARRRMTAATLTEEERAEQQAAEQAEGLRQTEIRLRLREFAAWPPPPPSGPQVSHSLLRLLEQLFTVILIFHGVPWFAWLTLRDRLNGSRRAVRDVVLECFGGEYLLVHNGVRQLRRLRPGVRLRLPGGAHVYLRLSQMLFNAKMRRILANLCLEELERRLPFIELRRVLPNAFINWLGPFVEGIIYGDIPAGICGLYVLQCGEVAPFNNHIYDGHRTLLRGGISEVADERIYTHQSATGELNARGPVSPLYCVEMDPRDLPLAERAFFGKLTELKLKYPVVRTETNGQMTETFACDQNSSELVHDIVAWIRYIFPLPEHHVTVNHPLHVPNHQPDTRTEPEDDTELQFELEPAVQAQPPQLAQTDASDDSESADGGEPDADDEPDEYHVDHSYDYSPPSTPPATQPVTIQPDDEPASSQASLPPVGRMRIDSLLSGSPPDSPPTRKRSRTA